MYIKLFLIVLLINPLTANARVCKGSNEVGINHIKRRKKLKIESTAKVNILIDDREFLFDAYQEAEDLASINIAKFVQFIYENENSNQNLDLNIQFNGKKKLYPNKKFSELFISNKYSTNLVMQGIKIKERCYVPGEFVKVTVQVSDESIRASKDLERSLEVR